MSLFGLIGGNAPAAGGVATSPTQLQPIALQPRLSVGSLQPAAGALDGAEAVGKPPLGTRVATAFKAAMRELGIYKGPVNGVADQQLQSAVLALQARDATARADVAKPATGSGVGRKVVAKTWKHAKAAPKPQSKPAFNKAADIAAAQQQAATAGAVPAGYTPMGVMPQGTMVTPGGVVIPAGVGTNSQASLQGLQGLSPQMQAQLGLVPQGMVPAGSATTMYGPNGVPMGATGQPQVPQANATNQQGVGAGAAGANQAVTNRNAVDASSRSIGQDPYGFGYGSGMGTPYGMSGYGASMNGSLVGQQQGGIKGFFSRLLS